MPMASPPSSPWWWCEESAPHDVPDPLKTIEVKLQMSAPYVASTTVLLRQEEFASDAENKLGGANGNTYQRKPGVPGVHDGQVMIRLKKKRFVLLDYGYVPNAHDQEIARMVPYISLPDGAGQAPCISADCTMVGVPCCLYDSEPNEAVSLYLRNGLCFTCQKNLNEKRRTQRKSKKRSAEDDSTQASSALNPDAVVINGTGMRRRGPGYGCTEMGVDLCRITAQLYQETHTLTQTAHTATSEEELYQRAFESASRATYLLNQWKMQRDGEKAAQALASGLPTAAGGLPAAVSFSPDSQQAASFQGFAPLMGAAFPKGSTPRNQTEI
ncbi:hypothetical protein ACHAXT_012204 [Thalassiosira profunda]